MITCKSPVQVMRAAHELGRELFDERAHRFSRRDYTLPRLFACLVLREHQKQAYRGVEALPADCSDLRAAVGLPRAPDHNTLWRAFDHLVRPSGMGRALDVQAARGRGPGAGRVRRRGQAGRDRLHRFRVPPRQPSLRAAATPVGPAGGRPAAPKKGLETGRSAADRRRSRTARRVPKLAVAVACSCHLILAARATTGLGSDHPHFAPLRADAARRADVAVVVADAGFDSEAHHAVAWDAMGIAAVIPPLIGRPSERPPAGVWRGVMRERFAAGADAAAYGQRWQVETVNSMVKRNLGSACRARTARRRSYELLLRCVTHNIMVLEGTEP